MTHSEKLQFTEGKPHEIINLEPGIGYERTRELHKRYGNEDSVASAYFEQVLNWPSIGRNEALDESSILLASGGMNGCGTGMDELHNLKTRRII